MARLNRLVATGRSAGFIRWPLSSTKCDAAEWLNSHENSYSKPNVWNSPNRWIIIAKVRVSQHNRWKIKRGEGGSWAHCLQEFFNVGRSSRLVWGRVKRVYRHRHLRNSKAPQTREKTTKKKRFPPKKTARRPSPRLFISVTTLISIPRKLQNCPATSPHHVLCAHELINRQLECILPPPTPPRICKLARQNLENP